MADFVTPRDLSHELGVSQKDIRDYLRQQYGLLADRGGTRWQLDVDQADSVRGHFQCPDE
jgi:hypothetical protein